MTLVDLNHVIEHGMATYPGLPGPELGDHLTPEAMTDVRDALEAEGLRLRATARAAALVLDAMEGRTYVPRL